MNRRSFLASVGLLPAVARTYFDMGASWQQHESGLFVTDSWLVVAGEMFKVGDVITFGGQYPPTRWHTRRYRVTEVTASVIGLVQDGWHDTREAKS